jgi:hypothetical protein
MAKYPNASEHRRVEKDSTQNEIDLAIGAGKFIFAMVYHADGSIDTFANEAGRIPEIHGPTQMRSNPYTGELEEEVEPDVWKPFNVKRVIGVQTIQIVTVERNPICKVIIYPNGTTVHYHLP